MYYRFSNKVKKKKKIWFASKILTLQQIVINNMNDKYPFKKIISENDTENYNNSNYNYYLIHSTKFETNYKKCGILDSMKNIMCIPKSEICPLNEIKTSLNENSNIYETGKYFNYNLYFTNHKINNSIITSITISDEQPKYITTDNFIFDQKTYDDETYEGYLLGDGSYDHDNFDGGYDDGYDGGGGGGLDIGDGFGGWRNLEYIYYGDSSVTDYILKKFDETINIDLNYQKIDNNLYYRNYIGFENNQQMEEFINTDFWNNYRIKFHKLYLIVIRFISTLPFLFLICFSICRLNYEDSPNSKKADECAVCCSKFWVIFVYMIFFLLFYITSILNYCDLHKAKINCNSLKKIKSEIIIEDFINSFCSDYNFKNNVVISEIVLLSVSFFIVIIVWIVHIIIQRAIDLGKLKY